MILHAETWGDPGDLPVVLLHGITANTGSWWEVGPALAARGRYAIAVDLPGHGRSPAEIDSYDAARLIASVAETVGRRIDVLIGHSFGGYLAQRAVLDAALDVGALVLEDPVSHQPSGEQAKAMLDWDRENLPRDVDGLVAANPRWSRLDAAWKIVSLEQVDWAAARRAFADAAPWDLRSEAARVAQLVPTWWVQPGKSRFVPPDDLERLRHDVGPDRVQVVSQAGHSIHRDALEVFLSVVDQACAAATGAP